MADKKRDTTKRQNFLQQDWKSYPVVPLHHDVRGRILSISGSQIFLRSGVYVVPEFWRPLLAPGDWISGLFDSKTVEDSLSEVTLLAPCLGLGGKSISDSTWGLHQEFQIFLNLVAEFFAKRGVKAVHTPTLAISPGTEPFLDVFKTDFERGRDKKCFYLPTSPELHLKKIMASRGEDIYEIRPCFRNGEIGPHHQPEFWMLEWYRAFSDLSVIQQDVIDLVQFLVERMQVQAPSRVQAKSISQLFNERLQFRLEPTTSHQELESLAAREKLYIPVGSSWDDLFFLLFLEKIERSLPQDEITFVEKYPPSQAALARLTPEGWGDRFEVYWQGLELGNAFHELNNPEIQRLRFQEDLAKKKEIGKEPVPLDEEFLQSLVEGMPPSAGIALGLERLFMALKGLKDLKDFRLFPM